MSRFNPDFDDLSAALASVSKPRRVWAIRLGGHYRVFRRPQTQD